MKDLEKTASVSEGAPSVVALPVEPQLHGRLQRWMHALDNVSGMEVRGIERVDEEHRHPQITAGSYVQMFVIWFAINCTANNMTLGILGPVAFGLGFHDAIVCCLFGTLFGSACTGYIASFGPMSGLRTLVLARYTMGYWPAKLCVVLNIVIEVGYGLVDCLVAGLILSAVNGHGMSVIVGIVISAVIAWVVATFGITWFHTFERYIWIPTVIMLFILIGSAGPNFNAASASSGSGAVLAGNRLSYFFLAASGPLGWAPAAADFYVYYPPNMSRWAVAGLTGGGIATGKLLIEFLGIGLASGVATVPSWAAALDNSTGALIAEAFAPLHGFGKFCAVVLALCVAANNIPGTYAAALNAQMLGRWFAVVPRPVWSTVVAIGYTAAAIGGRAKLLSIFLNFLSLIGYWVIIWITLVLEEECLFRGWRRRRNPAAHGAVAYDWDRWNDRSYLPLGLAALASFLIGWAGAIVCMYETYYTGPIAAMVGNGADMGLPVSMSWTAIVYPPLRLLELKLVGR